MIPRSEIQIIAVDVSEQDAVPGLQLAIRCDHLQKISRPDLIPRFGQNEDCTLIVTLVWAERAYLFSVDRL